MKNIIVISIFAVLCCDCGAKIETADVQKPPVKVRIITVGKSSNAENTTFSATIEETNATPISFSGVGTVKNVYVTDGEFVGKGKLIAELDAQRVQETYEIAKATLEQAEDAYARMKQLYDKGSLSEIQWVDVQNQIPSSSCKRKNLQEKPLRLNTFCAGFGIRFSEKHRGGSEHRARNPRYENR